jgi:hypothetical protein
MNRDLTDIPFDHYQRYAAAASLVRAIGTRAVTVLEVGANRQRLLGDFLPDHRMLYTDLEPQENVEDFVAADACALPFVEQSYDAVVSLDVLEHIPPGLRTHAVAEMARVCVRMVVIGCPLDRPWVHEAEAAAHAVWRRYFDSAYPWLEEHEEHGLVDASQVKATLQAAGLQVIRFGQGDVGLWATLMGAHFVKEAVPELATVVAAADRYYNRAIFEGDRSPLAYREFFIGLRHEEDLEAIRGAAVLIGQRDADGIGLLSSLGNGLPQVADRVREAEQQWSRTSELLRETEEQLRREALAHHHAGVKLQEMAASAVVQLRRADAADEKCVALETEFAERLQREALAHHHTGVKLQESATSAVVQLRRADAADEKCVALETEFAERLQREALAHHHTGVKLQESATSAVVQLRRADAADEKYVILEAEFAQTRDQLQVSEQKRTGLADSLDKCQAEGCALSERLEQSQRHLLATELDLDTVRADIARIVLLRDELIARVDALTDEREVLSAHVGRMSLRVKGLERRQHWASIAAAALVLSAIAGYFIWA